MLIEELLNLVEQTRRRKCESNHLELKAARKGCPRLYDTLSAFANQSGGGVVLFGIDESAGYEVCGVYDPADLQKKLVEQCLQMEPPLRPLCTAADTGGKVVVSAEIQETDISQRPCFYKGAGRIRGSYIRAGDADQPMTEYEVYSYEAYRRKIQDELRACARCTREDVSPDLLEEYLLRLKRLKPNLANLPREKTLRLQGLFVGEAPTLAGILLFSDYPQAFFPNLCLTAVAVPGSEMGDTGEGGERFLDNARMEGTLPQMLEQAIRFVQRNSAVRTIIDPDTGARSDKTDYPMIAVREIILNALIHRDYSIHTDSAPITLVMYRDRLVVENPGGLYGRLTLDTLGSVSADTRNPFLAGAMEVLGEAENRFSGIPTIRKAMRERALPPPEFEAARGVFRVTLRRAASSGGVSDDSYVAERVSGYGCGYEDVPSEEAILRFCASPRSRKDLARRFPGLTPVYLMTGYVNPLVEKGKLELSLPGKPKSKNQRFQAKARF
ncbi:MAG: putative DNA binding domain-containing protein [Spirochaetia bacterium]|jgi:ATP-dependent DNA helicase RecG|nr:putative DNA binding domain-containing protein [Spirochaetia bacterium]